MGGRIKSKVWLSLMGNCFDGKVLDRFSEDLLYDRTWGMLRTFNKVLLFVELTFHWKKIITNTYIQWVVANAMTQI